jgi:hypothetical protein
MDLQVSYDLAQAASSAEGIEQFPGRYWVRPSGAQWLDPAPLAQPTTHRIDSEFRDRVRAQAALSPPRLRRQALAVEYDNGMKAVVGQEIDEPSSLLDAGVDERDVASYLAEHAPDLLNRFAELVDEVR